MLQRQFERGALRLDGQNITRIQFRALVGGHLLRAHSQDVFLQDHLEALIPLEKQTQGEQLVLVYLGHNDQQARPCSEDDLATIRANFARAGLVRPKSAQEIFSRPNANGFGISILDPSINRSAVIAQLSDLYRRFNRTPQDVAKMLDDPHNIFAVASESGRIISAGIAEQAEIPFPGGHLHIAEITEAATEEGYGNMGVYTAVSTKLLMELAFQSYHRQKGYELDLVFGECNALSAGVLIVAAAQGRTFSADVCSDYGFPGRGLLKQQVEIAGPVKHTKYNDLLPAFLTPSVLYGRYLT